MALSSQELKEAALIGLRHQRDQIGERILQPERRSGDTEKARIERGGPQAHFRRAMEALGSRPGSEARARGHAGNEKEIRS
jgi:hypothetical protein